MIEGHRIEEGYEVFASERQKPFGAVRQVATRPEPALGVYVERAGDFVIGAVAIKAVHDGKVIVDVTKLDRRLRDAIRHAHDREDPDL